MIILGFVSKNRSMSTIWVRTIPADELRMSAYLPRCG
jgi:hypothetical protein